MKDYRVAVYINLSAESPRDAAFNASAVLENTVPKIFEVASPTGATSVIDLSQPTDNPWDEVLGHPSDGWRREVFADDTRLGYMDWVQHRIENNEIIELERKL